MTNKTQLKHFYYLGILVGYRPEMVVPPTWLLDFSLGMTCRYCRIKFLQTLHYHSIILGIRRIYQNIIRVRKYFVWKLVWSDTILSCLSIIISLWLFKYIFQCDCWLRINFWWITDNKNYVAALFDTELLLVQETIKTGSCTWSLLNSMLD